MKSECMTFLQSPMSMIKNPLFVPEFLQCTLDCLATPADHNEQEAFAALARTCRAFSEPSLNTLATVGLTRASPLMLTTTGGSQLLI